MQAAMSIVVSLLTSVLLNLLYSNKSKMKSLFGFGFEGDHSHSHSASPKKSLAGSDYDRPQTQGNHLNTHSTASLRSLIITFNHLHKSDEDRVRHVPSLMEKILLTLSHSTIQECQLDVNSTVALIVKAIPNDRIDLYLSGSAPIVNLHNLSLCLEVFLLIANANSNSDNTQNWNILNSYKCIPALLALFCLFSQAENVPNDTAFLQKWNHVSTLLTNLFKASLKKESAGNLAVFQALFGVVLQPIAAQSSLSIWKKNSIQVLESYIRSKRFTSDLLDRIHKNDHFSSLVTVFDQATTLLSKELAYAYLDIILSVLAAAQKRNDFFLANFQECNGYSIIERLLATQLPSQDDQGRILDSILQLSTLGNDHLANAVVEIDRDSPFQNPTFMLPLNNPDFQFRNPHILTLYTNFYESGKQLVVAEHLLHQIQLNPMNYFVISAASPLICRMVEDLDSLSLDTQPLVLAIIKHVVVVVGYVPYKELSLLFAHFMGFSQPVTTLGVAKTVLMFLESSSQWRDTLRDLGLVNTLASLVLFVEKEMGGLQTPTGWEAGKWCLSESIRVNFDLIMAVLEELVKNEVNLVYVREMIGKSLFSLLSYKDFSKGVLGVIRTIVYKLSAADTQDQAEIGWLVESLGEEDESVRFLLIVLLRDLLRDSNAVQMHFRNLNGFEAVFKMLASEFSIDKQHEFLKTWFETVYHAFLENAENRTYLEANMAKFEFVEGLLRQCRDESSALLIVYGLLGLSFRQEALFLAFSSDTQTLPTECGVIVDTLFYDHLLLLLQTMHSKRQFPEIIKKTLRYTLKLIQSSTNNRIMLSYCNTLKFVVTMIDQLASPVAFEPRQEDLRDETQEILSSLSREIATIGMNSEELRLCVSLVMDKRACKGFMQDLILYTISHGNTPSYFQIEPNVENASGRLCMGDYGRAVPPQTGYTFLAWINVAKFDRKNDIPLFTMVDNYGHERLSIFINKEGRNLYLRTVKALVKLGTYVFPEKQWVHLAIVHQKPMITASYAYLYVNGGLSATEKCSYMGQPGSLVSVKTFIGSFSHMPTKTATYSLKIGPIYFVGEHLMDAQTISIIYDIGFEYTGNWQGSWAAYLVGNQKLQKQASKIIDEEMNSPIYNQLATFAMSLSRSNQTHHLDIPEENFWLSICSQNHVENVSRYTKEELLKSDAEGMDPSLNIVFNGGHAKNGCKTCKYATIEGSVISVCPKRIIEGVWTLGGCVILLRLVEDSNSTEDLHKNLSILAGCVNNSWRNLADMERGQLYEILSFILKSKKQLLTIASLDVLLSLVGKSIDTSNDSVISNPSVVRHLVLDIELWRSTKDIQKYYLNQITDMIVHSSYRQENIHTLNKMAIIKRFIMMLEGQIIDSSLIPEFIQHLKIVLKAAWSGDVIKFICTSIMNTLPKDLSLKDNESENEYGMIVRNSMLMMIIEIVEERENNIACGEDLVSAVSCKWILLFLSPNLSENTVALGIRLFYSVWESIEYPRSRFKEAFIVIPKLLQAHFSFSPVYFPVLAVIFGSSIDADSWNLPYDIPTLMALLKPKQNSAPVKVFRKRSFTPDMLPSLLALLGTTVKTIADNENLDDSAKEKKQMMLYSNISETTIGFLASMYMQVQPLREALSQPASIQELLSILFMLICKDEFLSVDSYLDKIKSENTEASAPTQQSTSAKRKLLLSLTYNTEANKNLAESRFISSDPGGKPRAPQYKLTSEAKYLLNSEGVVRHNVEAMIELILIIFVENVLDPSKSASQIEALIMSFPFSTEKSFNEFQEFIMLLVIDALSQKINRRKIYVQDAKILGNLVKLTSILLDWVEQDKTDKLEDFSDFLLMITKIAWEFEEESMKNGGKVSHDFPLLIKQMNRSLLYRAKKLAENKFKERIVHFLKQICLYHQIVINISLNNDGDFLKCIMFHLIQLLNHHNQSIVEASLAFWKKVILQKPVHVYSILKTTQGDYQELVDGFSKLLEGDGGEFLSWYRSKQEELTKLFGDVTEKAWEEYVATDLKNIKDSAVASKTVMISKLKKKKRSLDHERSVFVKYSEKTRVWLSEIQTAHIVQRQKFKVDYKLMQSSLESEWKNLLAQLGQEHAILAVGDRILRWKLDFTEGKARTRRKFRQNEKLHIEYQSKAEKILENLSPILPLVHTESIIESWRAKSEKSKTVSAAEAEYSKSEPVVAQEETHMVAQEVNDIIDVNISKVPSVENMNDAVEDDWEEVKLEENQSMKIQRLLQPGDSILDIVNCARLVGLELIEGIVLICQNNIYIVDKYFQNADGEVLDLADVAVEDRNIYHLIVTEPNRKVGEESKKAHENEKHTVRLCAYYDIKEVHKRMYLFRNVAIEMFLLDGRNFFLSFWNQKARDTVYSRLLSRSQIYNSEYIAGISNQSSPSALQTAIFGGSPLAELTFKWQTREISNLAYLMHLNTLAGRSYNDLTQYPTFPWVLSNYESDEIQLNNPSNYRDLSLPMGGQGESRAALFAERFNTWDDPSMPGCHYGTHYSSSMIVCSFLIRIEPFTEQYLKLQGGHFDHPDRLFHSIPQSWASASRLNTTDVRELIPEFYYLPDFLSNKNNFNFGVKQTGEKIHNVVLPPWAKSDPRLFIKIHREALESEWVSANIQNWIDLAFGYKQQGEEAAKALNVFHYLSYEGAVDIDKIEDPVEKQSTISIIHNFGQTPKQLFKKPHPKRNPPLPESTFRLNKNYSQLVQSAVYLKELNGVPVSDMAINFTGQLCVVGPKRAFLPGNPIRYLEWGHFDHSLRIFQSDNHRRLSVFESLHIGQISHAVFADQDTLITGGDDKTVCIWAFINGKKATMDLRACMRGHRDKITCIAASRSFSTIVSGSGDCTAIVWDLNRNQYTRSLVGHLNAIKNISINNNNGDILTCDGVDCRLWDINGDLISLLSFGNSDPAHCSVIFEGKSSEVFDTDLILTGHKSGVIKMWRKLFDPESKTKWSLKAAKTLVPTCSENPIELIWFPPSARYFLSSDSKGRVLSWMLPDSGTEIHYAIGDACLSCHVKLAVIGRKANCRSCGGLYCLNCISTNPSGTSSSLARCSVCEKKIEGLPVSPLSDTSEFWTIV